MNIWGKIKQWHVNFKHNRFYGRGNFRCRYCGVIAWESWCSDEHYEAYGREHGGRY